MAWPDGSPREIGAFSVQAFDAHAASTAPQPLGKPVALAADGRNLIPYRWTSTARRLLKNRASRARMAQRH